MAGRATVGSPRLQDILDAVAAVSSDVSMEDLLDRIVSVSARLVGARYGYLDVLEKRADRRLGRSARFGIDEAGLRASGPLPPARQLLVDLIAQRSSRLARPAAEELSDFICVPIESQGQPFGNLYLTDKAGGKGFTAADDAAVLAVVSAAGVVIENARLHERSERQRRWLAAAADITSTLRGPISRADMVQLVADRTREITSGDFVALLVSADERFVIAGV
ncbi:MAG: hypothetical protein QOJ72_66, partial [Nocardioidaceae bacterium]|nr:hypothetical protein [Nocardioidaceae bacterium]